MPGKLIDIRFKEFDANILSYEPEPRILIRWKLHPTTQNLQNLFFSILRGEQPGDLKPLVDMLPALSTVPEYVDYTGKLKNTEKLYYYKIIASEYDPTHTTVLQTFETAEFYWLGQLDYVASYIIEEHLFAFREVYGMPAFIYKKFKEGPHCPECWDEVLKRVTKSNCRTCKGTGFLVGYYRPFEAWMDFNPDPKIVSIAEFGERQSSQTDVLFTNYPQMAVGDVIIEIKSNKYWRVSNVRASEKNRVTILQVLRLDEINRSDIEYFLEVDEDRRLKLLHHLKDREKHPEF